MNNKYMGCYYIRLLFQFVGQKQSDELAEQLSWQLRNKNIIIPKEQIHLSNTIGQGNITIVILSATIVVAKTEEFGLVYKGYINSKCGVKIVAIKTSKGRTSLLYSPA